MRLSTSMIYDQQMRGISTTQSAWLKGGEQLATGNRVNSPEDDPVASAQAVVISQAQTETAQYKTARLFATQNQSSETTTLRQVTDAIINAQTTLVSASNGSLSDDDRQSYAEQLSGLRSQLLNLANSTDGSGRYVFAGYQSDKPPFKVDDDAASPTFGNTIYVGGDTPISQKVDASRTLITNHTGGQVFNSLTSNAVQEADGNTEKNIFNMLDTAIASLKKPLADASEADVDAEQAVLDKTTRGLRNALNNVSSVQSEVGTNLQELTSLDSKGDDTALNQKTQMSALIGADTVESISNYTMQQAALKASYTVFQQMSKLSLFNLNS